MNFTLDVKTKILAYADSTASNNPRLRAADWYRETDGISVSDPKSESHVIDPNSTKLIFDGSRTLTADGSTTYSVSLSTLDPSRYRFTHTGGTAPGFRTDRALALSGAALTFAVNANATVTLTTTGLFTFTGTVAGDIVFFPNTNTGDSASPVSVLNSGFWQVLAVVSSQNLSLARPSGEDFSAVGETQTLTSNTQMQAFSSSGVQAGDTMDVSAGFALGTLKTYYVSSVTAKFVEVVSTLPIAEQTGIVPGASGISFYTNNKRFLYIETDQEGAVRLNGDIGSTVRLAPLEAGNVDKPAMFMKLGPTWSLTIVNRSAVPMNALIIHCE